MSLLTDDLRKNLPPIYTNENIDADEQIIICKFFDPYGIGTWWITEYDGDDTLFGYVDLGMTYGTPEMGYISLAEIESVQKFGMPRIERDEHFTPKPWKEALAEHRVVTNQKH